MDIIKIVILTVYLFGLAIIAGFSWLYMSRTVRAINEIGLSAPNYINLMIKITISMALTTAVLIGLFLILKFY